MSMHTNVTDREIIRRFREIRENHPRKTRMIITRTPIGSICSMVERDDETVALAHYHFDHRTFLTQEEAIGDDEWRSNPPPHQDPDQDQASGLVRGENRFNF